MEPGQIFVLSVAAVITSGVTLSSFAVAWAESRKRQAASAPPASRLEAIEARLVRMEEAIESVAIEMERVAEGQRFTARLLAERAPSTQTTATRAVQPSDPRYVTPH